MSTYEKIATTTVGAGGASTISFSAIPQTYTDLQLVISNRLTGSNPTVFMRFNSDTTQTNYYRQVLGGTGSSAFAYLINDMGAGGFATTPSETAGAFASTSYYIPNYTSSNIKNYSVDSTNENNGSVVSMGFIGGRWSGTVGITGITIYPGDSSNWVEYTKATLYGITKVAGGTGSKATGGTVTTAGGFTYHTFFTSGMFTPTTNITGAEVLMVAGGGAGSVSGGGAGGLRYFSSQSYTSGVALATIVGAGGAGLVGNSIGNSGSNSIFGTNSTTGGGGGGNGNGIAGGSGGGGGGSSSLTYTGGAGNSGGYSPVEGFAGGGNGGWTGAPYPTGGGGGAGAVGGTANGNESGGRGGIGVNTYSAWASATGTGLNGFYAGGGGGALFNSGGYPGGGGSGGGGQGGTNYQTVTSGQPNTGGGGGGVPNGMTPTPRNNGGSGIIIVRYTT